MDSELTKLALCGLKSPGGLAVNELLRNAIERREALRKELEALDVFIRSLSEVQERKPAPSSADLFDSLEPVGFRRRRAAANEAAMDAAEKIILGAGRPLSRSELLRALEKEGHSIVGGDRSKVLGTNIWRSKRFHNLKGAGYWPISQPIPAAFAHLRPRDSALLDGKK